MAVQLLAALGLCAAATAARAEPGRVGLMGDVGVPDGLVGGVAVQAHDHIDLHLGVGHNSNSFGGRAGAAWLPLRAVVSPLAALELGGFLPADTDEWLQDSAKSAGLDDKTLRRVGYWYASLHLGARIGAGAAAFTLQGGLSFIDATADIIKPKPSYQPPVDLYRETEVRVWAVTGRIGLLYWF